VAERGRSWVVFDARLFSSSQGTGGIRLILTTLSVQIRLWRAIAIRKR
jgi:hypothetical protein